MCVGGEGDWGGGEGEEVLACKIRVIAQFNCSYVRDYLWLCAND